MSLTLPSYLLAMSHGSISTFEQPWSRWAQLLLSTPVVFGPVAGRVLLANEKKRFEQIHRQSIPFSQGARPPSREEHLLGSPGSGGILVT